ncbi:MAG: FAD-binding protein [Chloroflexi bacterium]|nr:FAD-binding protein [Chloroflexota bacterium]
MLQNWSRHHTFQAAYIHHPTTVAQLQEIVRRARHCKVLGSAHSFNDMADTTADLIVLDQLTTTPHLDDATGQVTVPGGMRYGDLGLFLASTRWALHNMASLPHISVAGTIATATHGSGMRNGNLASAVIAMTIVRADGELIEVSRATHGERFAGMVVHLGALGVVVTVTLQLVPSFVIRQDIYEHLPLREALANFDAIMGSSYSVSLFTTWQGTTVDQVWRKSLPYEADNLPDVWHGAQLRRQAIHPIASVNADPCTEQGGVVGPWHARLPHFKMEFTPSNGDELQSEFFVAHADAVAALTAIHQMQAHIAPVLHVGEIRTIAADDLWLSPQYQRAGIAIHFTWHNNWPGVRQVLPRIEAALAPFAVRPHWGKLFTMSVAGLYPRMAEFMALRGEFDPDGKFANRYLREVVG